MLKINLSQLPSLVTVDMDKLPACAGIYLLYGDDELLYIGMAKNIWNRLNVQAHPTRDYVIRLADDPYIKWIECSQPLLRCTEKAFVKALKPRLNSSRGMRITREESGGNCLWAWVELKSEQEREEKRKKPDRTSAASTIATRHSINS